MSDNPFTFGPVLGDRLTGRQAFLDRFLRDLHADSGRVLVLHAPPGHGKTSLLHEMVRRLEADRQVPVRLLNLSLLEAGACVNAVKDWLTDVKRRKRGRGRPSSSGPGRPVLLLDDADGLVAVAVPILEELNTLAATASLTLVLALTDWSAWHTALEGRLPSSPLVAPGVVCALPALDSQAGAQLLRQGLPALDPGLAEDVSRYLEGNPFLLTWLGSILFAEYPRPEQFATLRLPQLSRLLSSRVAFLPRTDSRGAAKLLEMLPGLKRDALRIWEELARQRVVQLAQDEPDWLLLQAIVLLARQDGYACCSDLPLAQVQKVRQGSLVTALLPPEAWQQAWERGTGAGFPEQWGSPGRDWHNMDSFYGEMISNTSLVSTPRLLILRVEVVKPWRSSAPLSRWQENQEVAEIVAGVLDRASGDGLRVLLVSNDRGLPFNLPTHLTRRRQDLPIPLLTAEGGRHFGR
jgi:hypothetical protein